MDTAGKRDGLGGAQSGAEPARGVEHGVEDLPAEEWRGVAGCGEAGL